MTDFYKLVDERQSDRGYDTERSVPREAVMRIVDAARRAPSACNSQPWHFIVVVGGWFLVWVLVAPICTARVGGWIKNLHFPLIDCGIAASYLTLAAADEGLGSCMMGWFDEKRLKRLLGVPRSRRVLLVVSLGYSTQPLRQKQRRALDAVMGDNKYCLCRSS